MTTPVNVFGAPVTGDNGKDRATKAYNHPNAGGKLDKAVTYVKEQKALWGDGVATLCIFYNATGQELNVSTTDSKYGRFYGPLPPPVVENGQWGAFLHVQQNDVTTISEGFVAYKGLIKEGPDYSNELLGWMTTRLVNTIHCDIFLANVDPPTPDQIYKDIETNPQYYVKKFGMLVIATLEDGISKYILTRDDVA